MTTSSKAKQSVGLKKGSITSTNEMGMIPRMPDMKGNCPLLLADLSDEMCMPGLHIETSVSAEVIHASEQALYLFRLQIGATLVCWLADPKDPAIHAMLQAWAIADYMFVAVKTKTGVIVRTRLVCGIPPSIKDVNASSGQMDAERFLRSTIEVGTASFIKSKARSDIASVQKIWKVRLFHVIGKVAEAIVDKEKK